jgi:excisionase family DNA binding protein
VEHENDKGSSRSAAVVEAGGSEVDSVGAAIEPEMMTYVELARRTGIKIPTLYAMVSRGEIPHYRLGRRIVRFSVSEIRAWLNTRYQPGVRLLSRGRP